jgi:hypothetical protein
LERASALVPDKESLELISAQVLLVLINESDLFVLFLLIELLLLYFLYLI